MIKNKKEISIAILVAMIVIIAIAIIYQRSAETLGTEEFGNMTIEEVVVYQKTCGDMQKKLGKESLYPVYYTSVEKEQKESKLNVRKACDEVDEGLLRYQALEWYAKNHGMTVTDADVVSRIETLIDEMKTTEEYLEYQKAAEKLGTTYEDIVRNDYQTYYFAEVLNRVYTHEYDKFMQNGEMTKEEMEQQDETFQKYWDSFENNVMREYRNSKTFDNTNMELSKCRTLAVEDVTTISQIKKAGL